MSKTEVIIGGQCPNRTQEPLFPKIRVFFMGYRTEEPLFPIFRVNYGDFYANNGFRVQLIP